MQIINLTPHEVHELQSDTIYPAATTPARAAMKSASLGQILGIETFSSVALPTENLPEPEEGTYYIVSALVLAQHPDRMDLLAPGIPVRDNRGRAIGCKGFRRNPLS